MKYPALATALLATALPAQQTELAQVSGGSLRPDQACYDVRYYGLDLRIDPDARTIEGHVDVRADIVADTEQLAFDLDHRLTVDKVSRELHALHFERDGNRFVVALPEPLKAGSMIELRIDYGGKPRVAKRAPWDGGLTWAKTRGDGLHWVATSCQGEGADLWWPCKDHPSDEPDTMDIRYTFPSDLVSASNGVRMSDEDNGDGTRTTRWHIANPINIYNVTLNLGPYVVIEDTYESTAGDEVPVFFWVLKASEGRARKVLPEFLDHLRFFEETCGPYAFRNEKYGIVETPFLGMEHQTCIAYGYRFRRAQFDYDWLHHHELSHEWWGNLVSCADWKDMWIHEGIGTYTQALYIERNHGEKAYFVTMGQHRRQVAGRRAIAPREATDSKQIYFAPDGGSDNDIYYKGSCVMHTLRWLLEDEVFFAALRRMAYPDPALEKVTDGSQCRHADTEEIRAIAEKVSGVDLEWFFEVYLRGAALPELVSESIDDELILRWKVEGYNGAFPMPVPVQIGGEMRRVDVGADGATIQVPRDAKVEIDPNGWVLKRKG